MATECPSCSGSRARVIDTRQQWGRGTCRRMECVACGERWTSYNDEPPRLERKRPLSPAQIHSILTSNATKTALAAEFKTSRTAIARIWSGDAYRDVHPEIPRPINRRRPSAPLDRARLENKGECVHWRGHCGLDLPDAIEEGREFCRFCPAHQATNHQ